MRIVYLATADARGHLMRAQLLVHALRNHGATLKVLTTSDEGVHFLREFGIEASLVSLHYTVQFDQRQNMLRAATEANVASYLIRPSRMLRDVWNLRAILSDADLIINDSFHPALLFMGCMPVWRHKVVHVFGTTLRHALECYFVGRLPKWSANLFRFFVTMQIKRSRAQLEHCFSHSSHPKREGNTFRLPTPVAVVQTQQLSKGPRSKRAVVYLNPHFRDPMLAEALELGLADADMQSHFVGEGYPGRPGWRPHDPNWVDFAADSAFIVSAPGMAALSIALVYRRPILLIVTEQPEQRINAVRAAEMGLLHRTIVWRDDPQAFREAVCKAGQDLIATTGTDEPGGDPYTAASARLQAWVSVITDLAQHPQSI